MQNGVFYFHLKISMEHVSLENCSLSLTLGRFFNIIGRADEKGNIP